MKNPIRFFLFLFCLLSFLGGGLLAQSRESGVIQGRITDSGGGALPGVNVVVSSVTLMGVRTVVTDHDGKFRALALPGGNYTIEATLSGFDTMKKTDVILHVGTTATVDLVLNQTTLENQITVTGEAPIIDVQDAALAKTFLTKDVLQNIPTMQNTLQIMALAPGALIRRNVTTSDTYVNGGSRISNSWQLDGVELTDSWTGGGSYTAPVDYNIIEEAQIIGLGAPAEYGNYTGAVVNIITKSGGNIFSGDAQLFYGGMTWQSKNNTIDKNDPYWALVPESPISSLTDASFHLGGPIFKDKLWFFGSFEYSKKKDRQQSVGRTRTTTFPKAFFKLTFQPDQSNRFQAFFEYHNNTTINNELSTLYLNDSNDDVLYPVYMGNISYLHMFSPSTVFEIKADGYDMNWVMRPSSRNRDIAGHVDLITGVWSRNLYTQDDWYSSRVGTTASVSTILDKFIVGSHALKFGAEFERARGGGFEDFNGPDNVVYWDLDGSPYLAEKTGYVQDVTFLHFAFYAQDSWKITENFVLNPGLRYNIYRGSIPPMKQTVYTPTGWEPRVGFVWDLFKDHKTVLKAHYGRYLEGTKTYAIAQMTPGLSDTYYTVGPNWSSLTELYTIPAANLYSIDPNIKQPGANQFVLGLEQALGKNFSASVSIMHKNWFNLIDPVNTGSPYQALSYTDPTTGQVYTIYNNLDPSAAHYYITNPVKGKDIGAAFPGIVMFTPTHKYDALEISLTKRMSNNWQLAASYVYSHETGNYSTANIPGMTTIFLDPNNEINATGQFPYSIPHIFKLQGTYFLPLGFSVSAFYNLYSGTTWTRRLTITGFDQGLVRIWAEPQGSRRLQATNILDLRAEKSVYYKEMRLSLTLDIFNLFNQSVVTDVAYDSGLNLGKPIAVTIPRSFRMGLKLFF